MFCLDSITTHVHYSNEKLSLKKFTYLSYLIIFIFFIVLLCHVVIDVQLGLTSSWKGLESDNIAFEGFHSSTQETEIRIFPRLSSLERYTQN